MGAKCIFSCFVHLTVQSTQFTTGLKPQDSSCDDEKVPEPCLRWVFKGALGFKDSLEAFVTNFQVHTSMK